MAEATILKTPELPLEQLGITETMVKFAVPIRRDVWLVMQQMRSLRAYGRPVFQPARVFYEEAQARAYFDGISPGLRDWYHVARGFTWEAREVWIDRGDLPDVELGL